MNFKLMLAGSILAMVASLAVAANTITIDGSTPQTTSATLTAMRSEHTSAENCQLTIAIARIRIGDEKQAMEEAGSSRAPNEPLGPLLNGLTYSEILALASTYPGTVVRSSCSQQ